MTNDYSLSDVMLKLSRAEKHLRDLDGLIGGFLQSDPYRVVVFKNPPAGGVVIQFELSAEFPEEADVIAGDAIHNLRSALDHLAANMVRASGKEPTRNTGFPIYHDQPSFNGGIRSKLLGASMRFLEFVRAQKPYRDNGNAWFHNLSQLDNADKHLTIVGTAPRTTVHDLKITGSNGTHTVNFPMSEMTAEKGYFHILPGMEISNFAMDERPTFEIAFKEGTVTAGLPVLETIRDFADKTRAVVTEATKLFR